MSGTTNYDVLSAETGFIDGLRQIDLDALGNGVSENPGSTESQDAGSGEEYQGSQPTAETDVFDDDSIFNYDFDLAARGIAADAGASDVSVSDGPALAEEKPLVSETVTTLYDADGNITGYSIVTTGSDASRWSYSYAASYDASWNPTGWSYSDSSGSASSTTYEVLSDADGNITGYSILTTGSDASGFSYTYTNSYDARWNATGSSYSDSSGYASSTTYEVLSDADGNITGYSIVTTGSDASGSSYTYANNYDASWNLTESSYYDSSGYSSSSRYETITDADGNFAGYMVSWTVTNADGSTYSLAYHYDASGNLIDAGGNDGSGDSDFVMIDDGSLTGDLVSDLPEVPSDSAIDTLPLAEDPFVLSGTDDAILIVCYGPDDLPQFDMVSVTDRETLSYDLNSGFILA